MRIRFLEIAEIELDEAVKFYNHELPGLGDEFLAEVVHALDRRPVPGSVASLYKENTALPDSPVSLRRHIPAQGE